MVRFIRHNWAWLLLISWLVLMTLAQIKYGPYHAPSILPEPR